MEIQLPAVPFVQNALAHWRVHERREFHYFFTWLSHAQGVTRISGFGGWPTIRKTDHIFFEDETAALMFAMRWG